MTLILVDHFRCIDKARLRERTLHIIEQRVGHLIGTDIADGRLREWLERGCGELGVILFGIVCGGIARCRQNALDAAPALIALRRCFTAAKGTLANHGHLVVAGKDHRVRVAIGRRHVREIPDIAAHVIVIVLHQQHVDLFLFHCRAHRAPTALELGI